jgi:hypothetical protein
MSLTKEQRAASSLRMKERWQKLKAQSGELPADPAVREAMAKVPMNEVAKLMNAYVPPAVTLPPGSVIEESQIAVDVDWEHIPLLDGQRFYAQLKAEFERAGKILNERSMQHLTGYTCFMCKKHFNGNPGFTDYSYVDPQTGLAPRIDCCGELCVINYNAMRINQRHQKSVLQAQQERNG